MESEVSTLKNATVQWSGGMGFAAHLGSGHTIQLDAAAKVGGEDRGPRPAELILAALGGCTGMDVVSILQKMRIPFKSFEVAVDGDTAAEHPKVYTDIHVRYRIWGDAIPPEKLQRAAQLSQERYCSVSNLLRHGARIHYHYEINGALLPEVVPAGD